MCNLFIDLKKENYSRQFYFCFVPKLYNCSNEIVRKSKFSYYLYNFKFQF